MKKNLTFLTGIVFLITILLVGSCNSTVKKDEAEKRNTELLDSLLLASKKIYITCKAVEAEDGSLQFTMADKDDIVVATPDPEDPYKFFAALITEVKAKKRVIWQWAKSSQVEEFLVISPKETGGNIMPGDAEPLEKESRKKFKYDIPDDAKEGEEKYIIQFIWKEDTVTIDPYLEIPPE